MALERVNSPEARRLQIQRRCRKSSCLFFLSTDERPKIAHTIPFHCVIVRGRSWVGAEKDGPVLDALTFGRLFS